jgi:hypothetical protein
MKYGERLKYELGDTADDSQISGQNHCMFLKNDFSDFTV